MFKNACKVEYVWLDGTQPTPMLRSKTKVCEFSSPKDFSEIERIKQQRDVSVFPEWSFDGSSTEQAEGDYSDCLLEPVSVIKDSFRTGYGQPSFIVLCEVKNPDGTPHESNTRHKVLDAPDAWFGFEQEYTILNPSNNSMPIGFPQWNSVGSYPRPQGPYYCSVGYENVQGRSIAEQHLTECLENGLHVTGINAEVMLGQWEFQLFGKGTKEAADDLILARYLLQRIAERNGLVIGFSPKPVKGDWNGSGMHTNFSTQQMRDVGGEDMIKGICEKFKRRHYDHIEEYGVGNAERLTGYHETQDINKFSYGVSHRGASIRIPISTVKNDWKGYLEDRRPASNADPYRVTNRIMQTLQL